MRWQEISPHGSAPRGSGLYCVYADQRLVYIGQAVNLHQRINCHQLPAAIADGKWKGLRIKDLRLKVSLREVTYLNSDERRLIDRLNPSLNVAHNKRRGNGSGRSFANEMHLQYG